MSERRALIEAILEGVPLPATREDLERYAREYGYEQEARALSGLDRRRYASIDEVGEALQPVQPKWQPARRAPRPESDLPPGGAEYGV